jgi:hypothetical protein
LGWGELVSVGSPTCRLLIGRRVAAALLLFRTAGREEVIS